MEGRRHLGAIVWIYAAVLLLTSISLPLIDALSRKSAFSKALNVLEHETFLELFQVGQNFVSLICLFGLLSTIWWEATCRKPRSRVGKKLIRSRKMASDKVTALSAPIANPEVESVSIETTMTSELRPYIRHHPTPEVNLYLRLGALGFGFGVLIYDSIKISDHVHDMRHQCEDNWLWIPNFSMHFVFIFLQTFFLVKHHSYRYTRHLTIVFLAIVHLIITNLGQWFAIVVYEVYEGLMEHDKEPKNHTQNSTEIRKEVECSGLSAIMAPHLFPCVIEYSLICAAVGYHLLEVNTSPHPEERGVPVEQRSPTRLDSSECAKSHKGLFLGLVLFMATVVSMIIFFLFSKQLHSFSTFRVYQITECSLLGVTLIGAVIALYHVRKLRLLNSEVFTLDVTLLCFGFSGVYIYDLFVLIPAVPKAMKGDIEGILFVVRAGTEILQTLVQFLLIMESERRCARNIEQSRRKPGRTIITCLLITNLALWLVNTFQVKWIVEKSFQAHYYNEMAWAILTRVLLPLLIFYRFHSSVCLSSAWSKIYRLRDSKKDPPPQCL